MSSFATYQSIERETMAEFKEKGSKFLGFTAHCSTEDEALAYVERIRSEHHKANHHCYAYVWGYSRDHFRYNDDGEPSGTAGKPIYGQLLSNELYFSVCIVVRYFGGTKLGVSGLIQAYKHTAQLVLEVAPVKKIYATVHAHIDASYDISPYVRNFISENNFIVVKEVFDSMAHYTITLPKENADFILRLLAASLLQRPVEDITDPSKEVEGLKIKIYERS